VLMPQGWCQVREKLFADDGDKQIQIAGESAYKPSTIAQGKPDASASPVCSCAAYLYTLHTRPRVQRAPGFPCAL
ncbi:MAG TPA: hypothetical protein VD863_15070, partial [Bradyrhizobium sp.]|nr:hypothetical protein [Bradyrhizobium sp.]